MKIINFDFLTLKAFLEENSEFLVGSRIQKIQQPTRQELIFNLRNKGESRKFYINIHPSFFHVCFMKKENETRRLIEIPKKPPMFCMLLRKYLENAKISKVVQPEHERILEFYIETYNELNEKIYLCLAIELMGKHSNVILYNFDTNVIIGCAHNVGDDKSRVRELIGGLPYVYPPVGVKKSFYGFYKHLLDNFSGTSINEAIDDYFSSYQEQEKIKSMKTRYLSLINSKLKKINNSLQKLEKQADIKNKSQIYRKKGDLVMANLFKERDFSSIIEILDYETNSMIKIELDATKTLKENANNFYKLYNKSKVIMQKTLQFIEQNELEKNYLEQVLYSVDQSQGISDLLEISEEIAFLKATINSNNSKKQDSNEFIKNILTFDIKGFKVYVGKNNKQNDYIISKIAKDDDLWFHTRQCAGAHVLLKVENNIEPLDDIIIECAKLAKEFSAGKDSSKVGVIYTRKKFIKKPSGAKLGYVTYKEEKEIIID